MTGRRALTYTVLGCAAAAGLALFAATRPWAVEVTVRTVPLPALRVTRTGADLAPWLPAVAVVGLAGAGALIATRGAGRRLVGALLVAAGLAAAGGGISGITAGSVWPALCVVAGLSLAAGGLLAVVRGRRWPGMGTRYERAERHSAEPVGAMSESDMWEALDRGEDPTADR